MERKIKVLTRDHQRDNDSEKLPVSCEGHFNDSIVERCVVEMRYRNLPHLRLCILLLCGLVLLFTVLPYSSARGSTPVIDDRGRHLPVLTGGWYLWDPYQFVKLRDGDQVLTGLDVETTRAIARAAGFAVDYSYRPWKQHIMQLRSGQADIASGATFSRERAEFAWFSRPYRQETNVLYLLRGKARDYRFATVAGMLRNFRETGFRLGVVSGFTYADPALNAFIADPANAGRIIHSENDYQNFRNLIEGRIDGLLADRLVAATSAWRGGWRNIVEEHPLHITTDIRFMFSKLTVPPETVRLFDNAIAGLEANGELRRMVGNYLTPVLLAQTLDSRWFILLDIIGTVAFALSGVLIAARERYSLLGAAVLALLPAVGGGIIRDLLVGRSPLGVLSTPLYLGLVGGTVLAGFLVTHALRGVRRRGWLPEKVEALFGHPLAGGLYEVSDAIGIAAFTVTGVAVAVSAKAEPVWMWGAVLAMITAAGGGMLRDLVRKSGEIASLKGEFYGEVPLIWGLLFSQYLIWKAMALTPQHLAAAVIVTMAGAFVTRMAAVLFRFKGPEFSP